jgi:hypothetical protein
MKSWKTTTTGVAAILAAICGAVPLLIDNDPATNPEWTSLIAAVMAGIGLLAARDNKVSSIDVGITKTATV